MDETLLGLDDKVALVTGAGMGIGKGCALLLARAGCNVAIVDLSEEHAQATAREVEGFGRKAAVIKADVRDLDQIDAMLAETISQLGGLDVCVNNVGGMVGYTPTPFLESTPKFFDDIVTNNLRATYMCVLAEAKSMIARKVKGSIICMSSVGGIRAVRGITPYGAAKAGIINLVMNAATELAPHGIRVNAIAPGTTATERIQEMAKGGRFRPVEEANPMGRLGKPEDLGGAAVYLASDLSSYVTGQLIVVDGGVSVNTPRPAP